MPAVPDQVILAIAQMRPFGLSPKAPGTMGSIAAVIAAPWLFLPLSLPWRCLVLVLLFIGGALAATRAEIILGEEDPASVVIDELVGQWLVLLPLGTAWTQCLPGWGISFAGVTTPLWALVVGLILFRLFDIWKPWLVRRAEHWMEAGWGVMLDDVVAGIMGLMVFLPILALVR